ncbi:MAG: Flp pilus assembly complex ATPase component TadA, partial [Propionibacteriaceae bacterium]|nr:Flp pilus assembly complex ATPase component TadA [Propionibacteriaceae bacterium]
MVDLDRVREYLAAKGSRAEPAEVAAAMRGLGYLVSDQAVLATVEILRRESIGAGVLDPVLAIPGVSDIVVNGPKQVFVDYGQGLEAAPIEFADEGEVRKLAVRLAASVGRRLDESTPFVDTRLASGVRVHAILGCLTDSGTCLSLRVPQRVHFPLSSWVENGTMSGAAAQILGEVVARRRAFLISGGTGSGKTTLLSSLLSLVPPSQRIVIAEDSRELDPDHSHCLRLESRPANAEGAGEVTLTQLVRQALRMRPDRLVVGEVRGAEVVDLLIA